MPKLGTIHFDNRILDALRDNQLVVFAGAGVSMGPPSNLPSFRELASAIAQGTGRQPTEPLDHFLGQLHHQKVAVHERAAELLSPADSEPNDLHKNLLGLFGSVDRVRLVTTNFDLHFEAAANAVFDSSPDVYRTPALPRGCDFTGIVYVHGSLTRARDLVLTDADFGRAYLTEGWGRRFLLDMFRQFTVLFVGYSHDDVVMRYLARALPVDGDAGRFALTHEDGNWDLLGIKHLHFNKGTGKHAYKELYDGVERLASWATRGALDWQSRMAEIGARIPPVDDEAISEVEQALREVHTTRFLTNVARHAEWPRWLNARKHLDALFTTGNLSERDHLLAWWIAEHYAIAHADTVLELVAAHQLQLNPQFWRAIGWGLRVNKDKPLENAALSRWVTVLLASAPNHADDDVLMWLVERCDSQGAVLLTLKLFLAMSDYRLNMKPGLRWHDEDDHAHGQRLEADGLLRADHWSLNEVWTQQLSPHLASIAQPLLSGITCRLENIHGELAAWEQASREWDPNSFSRSAIEPHEQDKYPNAIDVLVDAARDALEWLAINAPVLFDAWVEILAASDVPLLRRLSIHAINKHPSKSADCRLSWLLDRVGLCGLSEHHEVHRAVALSYATAGDAVRQAVVDAVVAHQLPVHADLTAEQRTTRWHFEWLSWLLSAKPDCAVAKAALAPIRAIYPDWQPSDHPDFTHWCDSADIVGPQSPWSLEQLLAREPREQINDLLNFQGSRFDGPDRNGLITTIREACKKQTSWAFDLAKVLADSPQRTSDLWPAVIQGLQEAELQLDGWRSLLTISAKAELLAAYPRDIANLLYALVRDGGKPFALDLLEQANAIALPLWHDLQPNLQGEDIEDWLLRAINQPAGVIVEFWIIGLSLLMRGKKGAQRVLPENYRQWFTMVVQDATSKGDLGRSILASRAAFLFGIDEPWAREHLITLFSAEDPCKRTQAWDGFLTWGRLSPALAEALMPAFLVELKQPSAEPPNRRHRFIDVYTILAVFHITDPTQQLLPELFQHGSVEDRTGFASCLERLLQNMQPAAKKQMWNTWLQRYWRDRLQSVPAALDKAEIRKMLDWLPHLNEIFPVASSLAVRAPTVQIKYSHLLSELRNSDLVTRYPTETAQLIIYLCNCVVGHQTSQLKELAKRLPALSPDLQLSLEEALVRLV